MALVKGAQQLLQVAVAGAGDGDEAADGDDDGEDVVVVEIEGVGEMTLDVRALLVYLGKLVAARRSGTGTDAGADDGADGGSAGPGGAATLLLLLLETVYEVLEHRTFHRQLLPLADGPDGAAQLQAYFLELSEQALQLLAAAARARAGPHRAAELSVALGTGTELQVTADALGESTWTWCLEILSSVQRVLDAPAFVAILQELLRCGGGGGWRVVVLRQLTSLSLSLSPSLPLSLSLSLPLSPSRPPPQLSQPRGQRGAPDGSADPRPAPGCAGAGQARAWRR